MSAVTSNLSRTNNFVMEMMMTEHGVYEHEPCSVSKYIDSLYGDVSFKRQPLLFEKHVGNTVASVERAYTDGIIRYSNDEAKFIQTVASDKSDGSFIQSWRSVSDVFDAQNIQSNAVTEYNNRLYVSVPTKTIDILGDEIVQYAIVVIDPTSQAKVVYMDSPTRCANQVPLYENGGSRKSGWGSWETYVDGMDFIYHRSDKYHQVMSTLANRQLKSYEADTAIEWMLPLPQQKIRTVLGSDNSYFERTRQSVYEQREAVMRLFSDTSRERGLPNHLAHTAYGMLQAVTEYTTHESSANKSVMSRYNSGKQYVARLMNSMNISMN